MKTTGMPAEIQIMMLSIVVGTLLENLTASMFGSVREFRDMETALAWINTLFQSMAGKLKVEGKVEGVNISFTVKEE
jgi:hypothetical protein